MSILTKLTSLFPHQPTSQQITLFELLEGFLQDKTERSAFILKGYAGTGKTTSMSALIKMLPSFHLKTVLLAPTGRAAKVLAQYTGKPAYTIHKKIYRKKSESGLNFNLQLAPNTHSNTLFLVDEASMITDRSAEGEWSRANGLLGDLISYIYNGKNCRMILIGDTAQLPPIGSSESPALDHNKLFKEYDLEVLSYELTEVVRQQQLSGILYNASKTRELILEENNAIPKITTKGFKDVFRLPGEKLEDGLNYTYDKYGIENTLLICRSNKNANLYNQQIRARILYREEEISTGDYLMVVKNNYFWLPEDSESGFIANGDIARIKRIKGTHEAHGFRFADISIELCDYPNEPKIDCRIILNTLTSESPSLSKEENKKLYDAVAAEYAHVATKAERSKQIKEDPYYNALQVKFAYAVTCHKAQGGQWDAVFVDQGFLTEEMINTDFLRWFYTATTRAVKELYYVNFDKRFFSED